MPIVVLSSKSAVSRARSPTRESWMFPLRPWWKRAVKSSSPNCLASAFVAANDPATRALIVSRSTWLGLAAGR